MDNKYIEQLRTQVKDSLRTDNMRYQHTLGVANTSACLAMCHGADMNKAYIAGLLHDVVEDCDGISIDDIRREFGDIVASYVYQESEDKSKTWVERKGHTIDFLKNRASRNAKIIALGDKLANIRALYRDYNILGEELWERFNMKDKKMQSWYYRGMIEGFADLSEFHEYEEYCQLVNEVFPEE